MTLAPILAFLMLCLASCKKVEDPEFRRIDHFRVKSLGLTSATIGFSITYFNPNRFGVSVKEAVADVVLDSVPIGQFTQDESVSVNKNSEFSIPLSGTITLETMRKLNLKELPFKEVPVQANGSVRVGKAGVYVTKPVTYQGRHRLQIKL